VQTEFFGGTPKKAGETPAAPNRFCGVRALEGSAALRLRGKKPVFINAPSLVRRRDFHFREIDTRLAFVR
jgi:hypothetical protein